MVERLAEWSEDDQKQLERRLWPAGPWSNEPDIQTWMAHGFITQAARHRLGHLIGYLLLPDGHPWHGCEAGKMRMNSIKAPGGITYGRPSAIDDGWVIGFHCAHAGDLIPGLTEFSAVKGTYRDMQFVRCSLDDLADKAKRSWRISNKNAGVVRKRA